jgi:enoyl-CoA hydratase/carnithine racemase
VVKLSGEKTIFPIKQIMATYIDPADTEQLGLINDYVVDPSLLSQLTGATVAGLCNRIKRSAYTRGAYSIAPVDAVNAVDQMLQEARQEGAGRLMKEAAAEGSQRRLMDVTTQGVLETVTWGGSKDGMN